MKTETYIATKAMLLETPVPKESRTYKPISNLQLIDLTLEGVHKSGFKIDKEIYSNAKNGLVSNGRYTIRDVADSEMQLQIGWQNSYDKSLSLKFALGTFVFICQNGMVSGDFGSFKKKHQGSVKEFTPTTIIEYIKRAGEAFTLMQKQREEMKEIEISKRTRAELIGRMFIENKFIESTQLNIIKNELIHPTHDYKCPNTLFELYQFTTYSLKETHPSNWMKQHIDAHSFFTENSKLIIPEITVPGIIDVAQLELFE